MNVWVGVSGFRSLSAGGPESFYSYWVRGIPTVRTVRCRTKTVAEGYMTGARLVLRMDPADLAMRANTKKLAEVINAGRARYMSELASMLVSEGIGRVLGALDSSARSGADLAVDADVSTSLIDKYRERLNALRLMSSFQAPGKGPRGVYYHSAGPHLEFVIEWMAYLCPPLDSPWYRDVAVEMGLGRHEMDRLHGEGGLLWVASGGRGVALDKTEEE